MNEEDKKIMTMNKLNYLGEMKSHIVDVGSIRKKIREELDLINLEDRCLQEFKREMESLNQEKMTHVEELRQIHSDINMLDNVQKQSEEDRNRRLESVKEAYQQLQMLKGKVDKMCTEFDMPRMFENDDEQIDLGDKRFFQSKASLDTNPMEARNLAESTNNRVSVASARPLNDNTNTGIANNPVGTFSSSLASLMSGFQDRHQPPYGRMLSGTGAGQTGFHQDQSSTSTASSAAFRQQPPPMKSCGSCHQQIHRNAPICPLCKAKSRSRHPKRRNNQRN